MKIGFGRMIDRHKVQRLMVQGINTRKKKYKMFRDSIIIFIYIIYNILYNIVKQLYFINGCGYD